MTPAPPEPRHYRLRLCGAVAISSDDPGFRAPTARRARALLALLALEPTGQIPRERLAQMLWPDRTDGQARANLRQMLSELRVQFHSTGPLLTVHRDSVALSRPDLSSDLDDLLALATNADARGLATTLNATDPRLMPGLDGISEDLDAWLAAQRRSANHLLTDSAHAAGEAALETSDPEGARGLAYAWTRFDACDEAMARIGFAADARLADPVGARRRLKTLEVALRRQLDTEPAPVTLAAFRAALESANLAQPAATAARKSSPIARRLRILAVASLAGLALVLAAWGIFHSNATKEDASEAARLTHAADTLLEGRTRSGYQGAETLLRRAVSRAPGYAPAWAELGLAVQMPAVWIEVDDPAAARRLHAEARQYVDRALKLESALPRALAVKGLLVGGEQGAVLLERAVALDPNDQDAWLWLGNAREKRHRYSSALRAFAHAAALAPAAKRAVQSYATLAWNMGYTATADAALSRFTTVSPNRFEVLVALADFNRIRGRLIDSADFADQATATAPPDPYKALVELVLVARAVDSLETARRLLVSSPGLRSMYASIFDDDLVVQQALANSGKLLDDPAVESEARALLRKGRGDLLVKAIDAAGLPSSEAGPSCNCSGVALGSSVVIALRQAHRGRDADLLTAAMKADVRLQRSEGFVGPTLELSQAVLAALDGDHFAANAALDGSITKGWRGQFLEWASGPDSEPAFAILRKDPAYQRALARFSALRGEAKREINPILERSAARISRTASTGSVR